MSAQSPQAHPIKNANEIPFTGFMRAQSPIMFSDAQAWATKHGQDVYWLETNYTMYYLPEKAVDNAPEK